jgi:hypothetical protein
MAAADAAWGAVDPKGSLVDNAGTARRMAMSWLSRLFGGGGGEPAAGAHDAGAAEEYNGFTIRARVMPAGSEFQLAGTIEKQADGETRSYDFVRADRFSSRTDAASATFTKGRQLIDEQGDGVFEQVWPKPN